MASQFSATSSAIEAVIDLDAIASNIRTLKSFAPNSELMAVVKADGYGHGAIGVAATARSAGATWLGVVSVDEALELRAAGDTGLILSWLNSRDARFADAIAAGVHLSSSSTGLLDVIAAAARAAGAPAVVHLAVDSGLGREGAPVGAQWHDLVAHAARLQRDGAIDVQGVWSHLAFADLSNSATIDAQADEFKAACAFAREAGLPIRYAHLANSAASLTRPDIHFDIIRPGLAVYGLSPTADAAAVPLTPAMTVTAAVVDVKRVPAGHGVGYGHTYRADKETTLVLLAAGYADGFPRAGSNKPLVSINGRRFNIAGRISMDQMAVDVGDHPVDVGDRAVLFGHGTHGEPTAEDWARECGTINYEIITRLGRRIKRTYVGGGIGGDL